MPTDIATRLASQEHNWPLEILGLSPPSSRYAIRNTLKSLGVIQQRRVHLGRNVPRRNTVYGDAPARPLIRKGLGHLHDGALGRSIGRHGDAALEGEQGAEVDDAALAAGAGELGQLEEVSCHVAAEGEGRVEVYLEDLSGLVSMK